MADTASATSCCPRCGVAFTCGMTAGHAVCWCARLPSIQPPEPLLGRCFCPDCLRLLADSAPSTPRSTS
ncbi:MAG: cysteine-rich CWC family protein [Rhodocyclales bacterium]|nr:cysteine-rich CWC family protein [Rhodocyclales bacterium]